MGKLLELRTFLREGFAMFKGFLEGSTEGGLAYLYLSSDELYR